MLLYHLCPLLGILGISWVLGILGLKHADVFVGAQSAKIISLMSVTITKVRPFFHCNLATMLGPFQQRLHEDKYDS